MGTTPLDRMFFSNNRKRLSAKLKPGSVAVINSNDEYPRNGDQNFPYRQNSDFFYLTGIFQERSRLLLVPDFPNAQYKEILFIRKANKDLETWEGTKLTKGEASDISGIENVKFLDEFDSVLREVIMDAEQIYLNANEYPKYSNPVPYFDIRFAKEVKEKFPVMKIERLAPLLTSLSLIKSKEEIEIIKSAIQITKMAFMRVLKNLKPGMKEYQVQAEITYEFMNQGVMHHAYQPIIATGENACFMHYTKNNAQCKNGEMLLMDFGAEYMNYASDLTRTIPVNGKFTKRQKDCYEAVLRVQKAAIQLMNPGIAINQINTEVNLLMEKEMIKLGLFSYDDVKEQPKEAPMYMKYFMHGTSHFIGLDVHDVGTKYLTLEPGMVITCEPGLYLREEKLGIRIENDILVTNDGPVDLTKDIPREVADIEILMR